MTPTEETRIKLSVGKKDRFHFETKFKNLHQTKWGSYWVNAEAVGVGDVEGVIFVCEDDDIWDRVDP